MVIDATTGIRALTGTSLAGLLFAVGLRLSPGDLRAALRRGRLAWMLPLNFVIVPALVLGLVRLFQIPAPIAVGMILLGAAPFAPVVPVFARLARADLALAACLTVIFPLLSVFLTPTICELSLRAVPGTGALQFQALTIFLVLLGTISLPLAVGVAVNFYRPALGRRLLRPVEIISEALGAVSLAFVAAVEFRTILQTGWKPLLAMALGSELTLLLGYAAGGPSVAARRVAALGTSNRNMALAILVAIGSYPNTPVVAAVVANGLLLIFLGLLHVACWRLWDRRAKAV